MENVKSLAIIPARSGSKGLKDKNIKLLHGKPLMAYTIEAALESQIFDEVYMSTDSCEYAEIAKEYGASVPFLRSKDNACDTSSSWDVVKEALTRYRQIDRIFDMVTLLQPTTPLRTAEDIKQAYRLYKDKNADAIISICEVDHSPLWTNTLPTDLSLNQFINKDILELPRQKLQTYYRINGAIYMINVERFQKHGANGLYGENSYAYIMDKKYSIDIDTEVDFLMAEIYMGQ
ncbi:MAG: acylneuraminate cytidylyltransferase family protein [Anaerolineaceae bacterium]|nr:MAG: acylneuraminate cytidylyltransferase family protein [Anaerolineaceae bacterium]